MKKENRKRSFSFPMRTTTVLLRSLEKRERSSHAVRVAEILIIHPASNAMRGNGRTFRDGQCDETARREPGFVHFDI